MHGHFTTSALVGNRGRSQKDLRNIVRGQSTGVGHKIGQQGYIRNLERCDSIIRFTNPLDGQLVEGAEMESRLIAAKGPSPRL